MTKNESTKKNIVAALICVGIGLLMGLTISAIGFDHWKKNLRTTTTTTVVTKVDTVVRNFTSIAPTPDAEVVIEHDTIFIDTNTLIGDYFTERSYSIDFESDSACATLSAMVSLNKLQSSSLDIRCNSYTTTITNNIETFVPQIPMWGVGIGTGVSFSIPYRKVGINLSLSIDYKRNSFILNYDPINRYTGIGYRYQVWNSNK